jgi:broad specificity phosphatase PhoE
VNLSNLKKLVLINGSGQRNFFNMPKVFLVRHGQSAAQTGMRAVTAHSEIPLTDRGRQQSQAFADSVTIPPDLIVASPLVRAQGTAEPLRARFPLVPFETWPVEEYTFLDPVKCAGTSRDERLLWRNAYFERNDPSHSDGNGAETFSGFAARGRELLSRIRSLSVATVYVFTHGFFMSLIKLLIDFPMDDDKTLMAHFYAHIDDAAFDNCSVLEIE